jgi:hypothetical protein
VEVESKFVTNEKYFKTSPSFDLHKNVIPSVTATEHDPLQILTNDSPNITKTHGDLSLESFHSLTNTSVQTDNIENGSKPEQHVEIENISPIENKQNTDLSFEPKIPSPAPDMSPEQYKTCLIDNLTKLEERNKVNNNQQTSNQSNITLDEDVPPIVKTSVNLTTPSNAPKQEQDSNILK